MRYLTDSKNYILDLYLEHIVDPKQLACELKAMVGVVEHGLFIDSTDLAILASDEGIEIIEKA